MNQLPGSMSMQDLINMVNSPSGQKLIKTLKSKDPNSLKDIVEKAQAGDIQQAKATLSSLIDSKEMKAFLKDMGG